MTATLTTFRQTVANELATELGIPFVPGRVEGPIENGLLGCSWPAGKRENADDANVEELEIYVRVLRPFTERIEPRLPIDPTPLEDLADTFQTALEAVQTSAAPWYFRVTELELDVDAYTITATLVGYGYNLFGGGS